MYIQSTRLRKNDANRIHSHGIYYVFKVEKSKDVSVLQVEIFKRIYYCTRLWLHTSTFSKNTMEFIRSTFRTKIRWRSENTRENHCHTIKRPRWFHRSFISTPEAHLSAHPFMPMLTLHWNQNIADEKIVRCFFKRIWRECVRCFLIEIKSKTLKIQTMNENCRSAATGTLTRWTIN